MADIKTGIFAKNVQKRLNRAQEKVLQKLGKADETKDEQFEQVVINFRRQESEGSRLQREMKAYMAAIKGMQQASINLTQSLHEVYEPDWHGKDDVMTIGKDCDALWENFHNKVVDSTLLSLDAYLLQFPDLKTRVAKRSRKLIDYDSARHHLETLQMAGMKNDRKMMKADEELRKAQRVFDELNTGLQDELPSLWDSRVGFYIGTFKSVTSLEAKFHREISLVCRQLYEVMTQLAEQHADKMFTIQGAPSDSGPLRLARTPSPPEDQSPPESPEARFDHTLRPVSPGPPRPKSPMQGPPVPPPPKATPSKEVAEEHIIDLFGGEFLPTPSPSQPNERPGESLLDLDFDAFQTDDSVSPIPQTAAPWDTWSAQPAQPASESGFVANWLADFGSAATNGEASTGEAATGAPEGVEGEDGGGDGEPVTTPPSPPPPPPSNDSEAAEDEVSGRDEPSQIQAAGPQDTSASWGGAEADKGGNDWQERTRVTCGDATSDASLGGMDTQVGGSYPLAEEPLAFDLDPFAEAQGEGTAPDDSLVEARGGVDLDVALVPEAQGGEGGLGADGGALHSALFADIGGGGAFDSDPFAETRGAGGFDSDPFAGIERGDGTFESDPFGETAGAFESDPFAETAGAFESDPFAETAGALESETAGAFESDPFAETAGALESETAGAFESDPFAETAGAFESETAGAFESDPFARALGAGAVPSDPFAETQGPDSSDCTPFAVSWARNDADCLKLEANLAAECSLASGDVGSWGDPFANSLCAASADADVSWKQAGKSSCSDPPNERTSSATDVQGVNVAKVRKEAETLDMSEDEAANLRFGKLYYGVAKEKEEDPTGPSFFDEFDQMNEADPGPAEPLEMPNPAPAADPGPAEPLEMPNPAPAADPGPAEPLEMPNPAPAADPGPAEPLEMPNPAPATDEEAPPDSLAGEEDQAPPVPAAVEEKKPETCNPPQEENSSGTMPIPSVVIEPASSNEGDDDRDADMISPSAPGDNCVAADTAPPKAAASSPGGLPADFLYKVETMHDFEAANSDELDLKQGDVVLVVPTASAEDQEAGWLTGFKQSDWVMMGSGAPKGLFPENFTQRLE
ncbi:amphiphysin isoform 2-T2 [Syngnathus typhle]